MPSTLKEIADLCGVTKQTVKNNLKTLGLWGLHVTEGDRTTPAVVDDEATAKVVAVITSRRKPKTEPPVATDDDARLRLYEEMVSDLKGQISDLRGRLAEAESDRDRYKADAEEKDRTIRALPSPDAVERARSEGRADGVAEERKLADQREARARDEAKAMAEAAAKQAAMAERQRIAGLHWWQRSARRLMNGR